VAVPDSEQLAAWQAIDGLHRSVARSLGAALEAERGISLAWYRALDVLARRGGKVRAGELAESLDVPKASLSRQLDRLEEAGWVRRERGHLDARAVTIVLTPDGRAVYRGATTTYQRVLRRRVLRRLDDRHAAAVRATLAPLVEP
jgi:DNA-binding MarR family transcriptional regulator